MNTLFEAGVRTARASLNRASGALNQVEFFLSMGKPEDAYHMAFNYARQVEKLLLHARLLPAYTHHTEAMDLMQKQIADAMPIEIGFTAEGWFFIRMPALLPKKEKGNADYIRSSLWYALKAYTEDRPIPKFTSCVLAFVHVYNAGRPERQYRDHDNIEVNVVIDAVASFVLADDAAYLCDHYYTSRAGTYDDTFLFVIPKADFGRWLDTEIVRKTDDLRT